MDDSNPSLEFDESRECNCCRDARERKPREWFPDSEGKLKLDAIIAKIKSERRTKQYDALIGLSGGVDSAYLAHYLSTEYDLRLLAVHVDGGWNTEAAVRNIEILVRSLDIDLHTYVVDWEEMRDLQVAFLRASVLNQDIPQDHAFFSTLFRTAKSFGLRYFLSGVNFSSESIVSPDWGYPAMDGRHVRAIHSRFGENKLKTFPVMGVLENIWLKKVRRQLRIERPLNYLPYDKEAAKKILIESYGYKDYGGKHSESRFTKYYQDVYLPFRYGFDKRRLHLSSLIVAGQITRNEALEQLSSPACDENESEREVRYIAKKLRMSVAELHALMSQPVVDHEDYPNSQYIYDFGARLKRRIRGASSS